MELLGQFIDVFLHLDKYLDQIIADYGTLTYAILFLIIFVETGLVVMPFLPGDSLLFAAGALAALPGSPLNVGMLILLLIVAAILGDTLNYSIGNYIGPRVFQRDFRFLKQEYLHKTQEFYNKHGGKTIIFARFIPIIRTFAPFVAGVGTMRYSKFIAYNVIGGIVWVAGFVIIGYFFGNMEVVKRNFSLVILGIIVLSVLPPVIEFLKQKFMTNANS
ncbi:MAG: DedA family protein [Hymenobacteraceae bacterium]|nr:DedA family protein [Hymenobacteraceae bacterium]MDX5395547.1 DedA family protein [Hymenobacteraceae bacterium]MDX5443034.1 DedA family protein [Hymenobacteraceae bacterium]MDX5511601.1 DedA family protein [Hymenobacteraceae bacterium]